jgi:transcriptional regulator with XRE-family HTH domain
LSQSALAERIGKTRSAVSQYESNTTTPYMYVIDKIADVLGVTREEIISDTVLTAYEKELLDVVRTTNETGKRELLIYARGLAATYPKNQEVSQAV